MRILVVSNYFPEHMGGIEYVAYHLVSIFRKKECVHWMACDVANSPHFLSPGDIPLKCNNFAENKLGFPYPIPSPTTIPIIIKEVRWSEIIHLHDCLYLTNLIVFILSRLLNKPVVITQHISPVIYRRKIKNLLQAVAYDSIGKLLLCKSERIVFISARVKYWFESKLRFTSTPLLIQNGIDSHIFFPASVEERKAIRERLRFSEETPILLFIGRFTEKKGLNIIKEIAEKREDLHWILIGKIDGINPQDWNLKNVRILISLTQNQLRDYYIIADLVILPSTGEGIPLVLQEAMACGTPVISTKQLADDMPNMPLMMINNQNAEELIEKIDSYFSMSSNIESWSRNVLNYAATQLSWEETARGYDEIYHEILSI